jgi:type VI secretion system secreted protein VgrG
MDIKIPNISIPIGVTLPGGTNDPFEFSAGPFPTSHFRVISFRGSEAMSTPFQYDLDLLAPLDEMTLMSMPLTVLRKPGYLHLHGAQGNAPRLVHGIISSFSITGANRDSHFVRIQATLVPKIWEMSQYVTSRIFQDKTVTEIVTTILKEWGIKHEWRLSNDLPNRTYATQYRESDLQFISRLLAEEGVFYFFEHPSPLLFSAGGGIAGQVAALANTVGSLPVPGGEAIQDVAGGVESALMEALILSDDSNMYPAIAASDAAGIISSAADAAISVGQQYGIPTKEIAGAVGASVSPALEVAWDSDRADNEDHVTAFSQSCSAKPESVLMGDYDFTTPSVPLFAAADTKQMLADSASGVASSGGPLGMTGGVLSNVASQALAGDALSWSAAVNSATAGMATNVPTTLTPEDYRVYIHDDRVEDEKNPTASEVTPARAAMVVEQLRAEVRIAEGMTFCRRLEPGHRFTLTKHPLFFLNVQYVVISMRCQGDNFDLLASAAADGNAPFHAPFRCEFSCVPSSVRFRPPVPNRQNRQTLETAMVVGPPGQEIYVDRHGRIKVQFHWDEEGSADERSSCWLRTMQAWSGPGFGSQFIPRIGMEVLVSFLNGNPDRPLVVGCLPNGHNVLPFDLPGQATRSGWQTRSSPKSAGFNELSFEDATHAERVYLHAQRDFVEDTVWDHTTTVGGSEVNSVVHNQVNTVGMNQRTHVVGHQTLEVDTGQNVTVKVQRTERVEGISDETILEDSITRILGHERREISKPADHVLSNDFTVRVEGCQTTIVGTPDDERSVVLHANGTTQLSSTNTTEIVSDKRVVIRVGDSMISIGPKSIELEAGTISLCVKDAHVAVSEGKIRLSSKEELSAKTKKMGLFSKGASIGLADNANIDGKKVNINCGPDSDAGDKAGEEEKLAEIILKDMDGNPLPHQRFVIEDKDGGQFSGVVDKDGKAVLDIEADGDLTFPDADESKEG